MVFLSYTNFKRMFFSDMLKFHFVSLKRSGVEKLTRSNFQGFSNRALFAYKSGRFASSFLLSGIDIYKPRKKANLSFKRPSPKPHLNWTGSVFALPKVPATSRQISAPFRENSLTSFCVGKKLGLGAGSPADFCYLCVGFHCKKGIIPMFFAGL